MNIAITGEGIISAIGTNKEEVLQSLLAHKSGIKEMQFLQSVHHELPVGEVALSNEQMKERLGIPEKQLMSRTELMGILAIRQALKRCRNRPFFCLCFQQEDRPRFGNDGWRNGPY